MTPLVKVHTWLPAIMFKCLCCCLWWRLLDYNTPGFTNKDMFILALSKLVQHRQCFVFCHEHCNFVIFYVLSQVYFTYLSCLLLFFDCCKKWVILVHTFVCVCVCVCVRGMDFQHLWFCLMSSNVRYTLSTSNSAIAALLCALYPHFPAHSTDNRWDHHTHTDT